MDKKKVEANKKGSGNAASLIKRITGNQLFIPVMAIVLLALINLIAARTEDKDNEVYKKVVEAYQQENVAQVIREKYNYAYIPVFAK